MTGAVLVILLAVEGYTILRIGRLLTLHVFLGMLLLGPVTLKAGSVLYRFARYYTGSEPYRRKGPPAPLLRIIGPINMVLTACVFGTGSCWRSPARVLLRRGIGWLELHRLSFLAWLFFMAIHVLAYVWRLPAATCGRGARRLPGGQGRPAPGGTPGGRWRSSAAVAPGWRCWSPRCWPAW